MTKIKKVQVPQPDLTKYEVDGKLFSTEAQAQEYLRHSELTPVYLVYHKKRPPEVEVYSSEKLAKDSLKYVNNVDKCMYVLITAYVDEFLR